MGWVRVSDDFYDNDKLGLVGPLGIALYITATGWCNRNLTDGFFPKKKARLLLDFDGIGITTHSSEMFATGVDGDDAVKLVIEWMVAADLWHEAGHDCEECHARDDGGEPGPGEFLIHDYLKYQPSREEVESKRDEAKQRMRSARESRRGSQDVRANSSRTVPEVRVTPSPNPNPTTGGVTEVDAREPRPHCPDHPNENSEGKCRRCMRRRQWDENHAALVQADELEQKRAAKAAAIQARTDCPLCDEDGWVLGVDGTPVEPAVKCSAHEQASG